MATGSILVHAGALLSAVALGGMIFFSAVVAPLAFRELPEETASGFVGRLQSVQCTVLLVLTGLAVALLWGSTEALVLAVVAALFVFSRFALLPRMTRAQDAVAAGDVREDDVVARLQRLATVIELAQMAALLAVAVRLVG